MRLLLVTYYFPPSGGAGVQRILKWTKYLRDFGVEPVVLTVEAGAYPRLDPTLLDDVPAGVAVHRTPTLDPFGLYARLTGRTRQEAVNETTGHIGEGDSVVERLARWVRGNLFIPDARVGWVPFAVARGRRLAAAGEVDAVLTSGPPHSVHLTGWGLQRLTGCPWIADLRDPWTDISYYDELPRAAAAVALDRALERAVLRHADAVVTVSPAWRDLLRAKVARAPGAFHVIHNGFDPADFEEGPAPPDRFVLAHVGSLYGSRSPEALWEALARLHEQGAVPRLRLRLVGRVGEDVLATLAAYGLEPILEHVPYRPHREATLEMQRATLLLLTMEGAQHYQGLITGKLYEYLAAGRSVLALGPPDGDAAALLRETDAGAVLPSDDTAAIVAYLREQYERWERGEALDGASAEAAAPYSRRVQAGEVAALARAVEVSSGADV